MDAVHRSHDEPSEQLHLRDARRPQHRIHRALILIGLTLLLLPLLLGAIDAAAA